MSIQNILDRNRAEVVTIRPTDTVKSAADRMRAHDIAALVVKSGAAITGLISDREIVHAVSRHGERALYMAVLGRKPRPEELTKLVKHVETGDAAKQKQRLGDVMWTLLNSVEFRVNH